jgi:CRP-like cAMP-binding protein
MIAIMIDALLPMLLQIPGRNVRFSSGAPVFRTKDEVKSIHVVLEGRIHLVRHQADGFALILQRAEAGAILAEASLHSPRYHCDAIAEIDSLLWIVRRRDLRNRLQQDQVLCEAWARHLAHEVQKARLHAEILSLKTVAARIDSWIDWHGAFPEKGRWVTVAQQIGISPEALYREMARRRKQHPQI